MLSTSNRSNNNTKLKLPFEPKHHLSFPLSPPLLLLWGKKIHRLVTNLASALQDVPITSSGEYQMTATIEAALAAFLTIQEGD